MSLGQLSKMTLIAYDDMAFKFKKQPEKEYTYTALINPESYTLNYGTEVNQKGAQGDSESMISISKRSPQSLSFKFLFDGTGVIKKGGGGVSSGLAIPGLPANNPTVTEDFAQFKKVVYG